MNLKKKICAIALAGAVAVSALSMGFASWQTTITGSGSVNASGKWDVAITDASLSTSTGASTSATVTTYELQRTGVKSDQLIAATIGAYNYSADEPDQVGTQSPEAMSWVTYYFAVDTSKYDLSNINSLTKDERNTIVADESTVTISDHLNAYYRNLKGSISTDNGAASATKVVDGLLRDTTALVKELFPDTWQNYTLCYLSSSGGTFSFSIADMAEVTQTIAPSEDELVAWTATDASFADVTFGLPGAWAQYTITVTNNGTVDANLSDAVIDLDTDSDQLVLDKPDLSDEVLKPGESCTITFVVKVPETITEELDATGTLTVRLPYGQTTVEEAPAAGHTHG